MIPNQTTIITGAVQSTVDLTVTNVLSLATMVTIEPEVTDNFAFYQKSSEPNQWQVIKGVAFEYALVNQSFSNRYLSQNIYLQGQDGSPLPDWLEYNSITGVLTGVWSVNSEIDSLDLQMGHKQTTNKIALKLILDDTFCASLPPVTHSLSGGGTSVRDMAYDAQGALWVVGHTVLDSESLDIFLAKFSSESRLVMAMRLGGTGNEAGFSLIIDANESIWVAGYTSSFGVGSRNGLILKMSSSGTLQKGLSWGGADEEIIYGLVIDDQSTIWASGYTKSFGANEMDALLIKVSPMGDMMKVLRWGGHGNENCYSLVVDATGSIWAAGYTANFGARANDAFLLKFSHEGELIQALLWGGLNHDYGRSLAIDKYCSVWLVGDTRSFGAVYSDVFLAQFSASGELTQAIRWGGLGTDNGFAGCCLYIM